VVPLFSWYLKPEEGPDSLFGPKEGEDPSLSMWMDERVVRWPAAQRGTASEVFLSMNEPHLSPPRGLPVVSLSHFVPRRELIYRTPEEAAVQPALRDRHPEFNFSRVAGSRALDRQVRRLGSAVHVYGHQHRNRHRAIDGVLYVSHCMGYPGEGGCGSGSAADQPRVVFEAAPDDSRQPRSSAPTSPARSRTLLK
jgi:hypothetical protein